MRIISGTHKGRSIRAPKNLPVRPTTDFGKEALFNILANRYDFEGLAVLDLFSGTGNIAYEFASRGSNPVVAVDVHGNCVSFIKRTAQEMGFPAISAIKSEVLAFLSKAGGAFDIVFADPPFDFPDHALVVQKVWENNLVKEGGLLIVEHSPETDLSKQEHFLERRKYSKVNFSIFGKNQ